MDRVNIDHLWQELSDEVHRRVKTEALSMEELSTAGQILWNLQECVNKEDIILKKGQ